MNKTSFKILSVVLALLMAFSFGTAAFAESDDSADNEINNRFDVILSTATTFTISGLTAECGAQMTAKYSTSLKIKMELQKKSSGTYSTVKTWNKTSTGVVIGVEGSKIINPLSTYRLKVTYTAGSETHVTYKY